MRTPDPRKHPIIKETVLTEKELEQLKETFAVKDWDAAGAANKSEIFKQLGELYNFPGYFGNNWDAFIDCLSDLTWIEGNVGQKFALIVRNAGSGEDWETLLDCLTDISARWAERGGGFLTVLVG